MNKLLILTLSTLLGCILSASVHAYTLSGSSSIRGWDTNTLEIHVNFTDCPVSENKLNTAVDNAIALWNSVPTSRITLVRGASASDTAASVIAGTAARSPLIICDKNMSADINSDANNIPAATSFRTKNFKIDYAYILLNAEQGKFASIDSLPSSVLGIVIAHEIGHVLGLGHSGSRDALMYFDATARDELTLSQDDMDGLTYLYPRNEPLGGGFLGCGTVSTPKSGGKPGPGSSEGAFSGALSLLILLGFCGSAAQALKSVSRREKGIPI